MENILSVRVVGVGGGVADHVKDTPKGWVAGRRRVIVLVHGYNNTEKDAKESYRDFTQHLQGYAQLLDLGQFFWPGDANLGFLSALSYPFEIKDAKESAARLAEFFAAAQGPQGTPMELNCVCHSLGCRLLLEVLRMVHQGKVNEWPEVRWVCLMAAAVQVDMVESGGDFEPGAHLAKHRIVLYSPADKVLHYAFPIGQTAAFEGFFPAAVGRFGRPASLTPYRVEMGGNDHSDYWSDPRSAEVVASFLGASVPRSLPARMLPLRRDSEERALESRNVGEEGA